MLANIRSQKLLRFFDLFNELLIEPTVLFEATQRGSVRWTYSATAAAIIIFTSSLLLMPATMHVADLQHFPEQISFVLFVPMLLSYFAMSGVAFGMSVAVRRVYRIPVSIAILWTIAVEIAVVRVAVADIVNGIIVVGRGDDRFGTFSDLANVMPTLSLFFHTPYTIVNRLLGNLDAFTLWAAALYFLAFCSLGTRRKTAAAASLLVIFLPGMFLTIISLILI